VRRAFNYAFPFEEINESIFYDQYLRVDSYFDGLDFAASGLPEGRELEILEEVRDQVPPEVFTGEYFNPVSAERSDERNNLRKALALLKEAGWQLQGGKLVNRDGEQMKLEFLMNGPL
jgi:microcin C transport system substrate-binding protein